LPAFLITDIELADMTRFIHELRASPQLFVVLLQRQHDSMAALLIPERICGKTRRRISIR